MYAQHATTERLTSNTTELLSLDKALVATGGFRSTHRDDDPGEFVWQSATRTEGSDETDASNFAGLS